MTGLDLKIIDDKLRKNISHGLYQHCKQVSELSAELASIYNLDAEKAKTAGLLHDCSKNLKASELLNLASEMKLKITEADRYQPVLLHAIIGAEIAKKDYGIGDVEILNAILAHTYGRKNMTKFDKIIYLADTLDPGREDAGLEKKLQVAKVDIDKAFREVFTDQLVYLIKSKKVIHPVSVDVWNELVGQRR